MDFRPFYPCDQVQAFPAASLRKFQCAHCFKVLSSKQNFKEHSYIHTGEKPFCCPEPGCQERFRQGSQLSVHRKMHRQVEKLQSRALIKVPKVRTRQLTELIALEWTRTRETAGNKGGVGPGEKLPEIGGKQSLETKLPSASFYVE